MTGLSPRNHGDRVFNEYLEIPDPERVPTLPGLFREAGYQAHAVGKLHVYPQRDRIGFDEVILNEEGRHQLDDGNADDWELYLADQGYPGQEYAGGLSNNDYLTRSWHLPDHCHPTNWAAAQMCRTIRRRDHRKPGFWYLSFVGPHPPVWPPAAYLDLYRNLELDPMVCGDWSQSFEDLPYSVKPYMDQFCMRMAIPGEIDRARRAFYATITHIDHQIRMVLGTLREERTVGGHHRGLHRRITATCWETTRCGPWGSCTRSPPGSPSSSCRRRVTNGSAQVVATDGWRSFET